MKKRIDELKSKLAATPPSAAGAPEWLPKLLQHVPGLPADVVPHNRPTHAQLQSAIAAPSFHPAIEACLHLINGDLYSAHFLVRKAQGGSRYLDWLHAILHKLEGDFRNAKMWYTDLGNSNASQGSRATPNDSPSNPEEEEGEAPSFTRFHEFWFVPATNGGTGSRHDAKSLDLSRCDDLPNAMQLTAHGHTDLVFLATLALKAASSKALSSEQIKREVENHHSATTEAEDKIRDSQSSYSLEELQPLYDQLAQASSSQSTVSCLTQLELVWMLEAMVQDFGWREYAMADAIQALEMESTPAHKTLDETRKSKASNMVLNPGQGQRKF